MTALYIILGLLAAFIVITLIRAAFFTAPKPQREEFPPEQVNGQRACDRLSQAIQIKTISCEDESQTDWGAFDRFHAFLEQSYPLIHKNLKLDHISTASLLFYWEGTDPDLDPIAFLAHQDVVPISEGTEEDWEHPAFDGVNDGQFIWGRGALADKGFDKVYGARPLRRAIQTQIEDPLSELLLEDKIHGTVTVDYKDGAFTFDSPADKDKQEQPAAPAAD